MKLPFNSTVQRMFALCQEYTETNAAWPMFATPKLNGVRAMWVPGVGFFSRDGIPYMDGVLPHLEQRFKDINMWIDCELYAHGLPLQAINSRAGVVRQVPHKDYAAIDAFPLDAPMAKGGFEERQDAIRAAGLSTLPFTKCKCNRDADNAHAAYISADYEGTVYRADGLYRRGRTDAWLKRKAWLDGEFNFVAWLPGEGKYAGTFGAVILKTESGLEFCVGSFQFDDIERTALTNTAPKRAKVKYLGLTDKGVPYHSRVLSFDL